MSSKTTAHLVSVAKATGHTPASEPALPPRDDRESVTALLDGLAHAAQGRFTGGLSPPGLAMAFADWQLHLANAPFFQLSLAASAFQDSIKLLDAVMGGQPFAPAANDRRFRDLGWRQPPLNLIHQSFLATEAWWRRATDVRGVNIENRRIVDFVIRQWLDAAAPSNVPWLNPEVLRETMENGGANLALGMRNFAEDMASFAAGRPPSGEALQVGRDLALTRGEVVYRNRLIELIQYAPTTPDVRPEPVLITPAWIMKYYILDLTPQDSLVKYLVDQGFTVFCISWRNPDASMRDVGFEDYIQEGFFAALDVVSRRRPGVKVHACGYCLGGTLTAAAAAAMARDHDDRLASLTLFATQTDFSEAGELQLFITESEVSFLEDLMWRQGYLDGSQMAAAFQLLRSNDLIWSRLLKTYLIGRRDLPNDLMSWNADVTRMPYRMHSEYLRRLFLDNDLAEGRFPVGGKPVGVEDIRVPLFAVATETDHIAPWRSVYKLHLLNPGELTFVLTSGGHNAGIVSEPGHPGRRFRMAIRPAGRPYEGPDEWTASVASHDGSWWPAWSAWLADRSGSPIKADPLAFSPLGHAPGAYVLET